MTPFIYKLRQKLDNDQRVYEQTRQELQNAIKNCNHNWSNPVADHIFEKGYWLQGDPPGTCGVDRQLPCYIEPKVINRWKRNCSICGEVQYTSKVEKQVTEIPVF